MPGRHTELAFEQGLASGGGWTKGHANGPDCEWAIHATDVVAHTRTDLPTDLQSQHGASLEPIALETRYRNEPHLEEVPFRLPVVRRVYDEIRAGGETSKR